MSISFNFTPKKSGSNTCKPKGPPRSPQDLLDEIPQATQRKNWTAWSEMFEKPISHVVVAEFLRSNNITVPQDESDALHFFQSVYHPSKIHRRRDGHLQYLDSAFQELQQALQFTSTNQVGVPVYVPERPIMESKGGPKKRKRASRSRKKLDVIDIPLVIPGLPGRADTMEQQQTIRLKLDHMQKQHPPDEHAEKIIEEGNGPVKPLEVVDLSVEDDDSQPATTKLIEPGDLLNRVHPSIQQINRASWVALQGQNFSVACIAEFLRRSNVRIPADYSQVLVLFQSLCHPKDVSTRWDGKLECKSLNFKEIPTANANGETAANVATKSAPVSVSVDHPDGKSTVGFLHMSDRKSSPEQRQQLAVRHPSPPSWIQEPPPAIMPRRSESLKNTKVRTAVDESTTKLEKRKNKVTPPPASRDRIRSIVTGMTQEQGKVVATIDGRYHVRRLSVKYNSNQGVTSGLLTSLGLTPRFCEWMTKDLHKSFCHSNATQCISITKVDQGSDGDQAGFQVGDVWCTRNDHSTEEWRLVSFEELGDLFLKPLQNIGQSFAYVVRRIPGTKKLPTQINKVQDLAATTRTVQVTARKHQSEVSKRRLPSTQSPQGQVRRFSLASATPSLARNVKTVTPKAPSPTRVSKMKKLPTKASASGVVMTSQPIVHLPDIGENDVVLNAPSVHVRLYQDIMEEWCTEYEAAPHTNKRKVCRRVIEDMISRGVRFLEQIAPGVYAVEPSSSERVMKKMIRAIKQVSNQGTPSRNCKYPDRSSTERHLSANDEVVKPHEVRGNDVIMNKKGYKGGVYREVLEKYWSKYEVAQHHCKHSVSAAVADEMTKRGVRFLRKLTGADDVFVVEDPKSKNVLNRIVRALRDRITEETSHLSWDEKLIRCKHIEYMREFIAESIHTLPEPDGEKPEFTAEQDKMEVDDEEPKVAAD